MGRKSRGNPHMAYCILTLDTLIWICWGGWGSGNNSNDIKGVDMRTKRLLPIILAVFTVLVLAVSTVWATTYHTIGSFTGAPTTDFASDEALGTDNAHNFYLT